MEVFCYGGRAVFAGWHLSSFQHCGSGHIAGHTPECGRHPGRAGRVAQYLAGPRSGATQAGRRRRGAGGPVGGRPGDHGHAIPKKTRAQLAGLYAPGGSAGRRYGPRRPRICPAVWYRIWNGPICTPSFSASWTLSFLVLSRWN